MNPTLSYADWLALGNQPIPDMTPDTTPAPMTLEDTLDYLKAMSLDMPTLNKLKRSPSSRTIEEWHEVIQGALHHLETAKRERDFLFERAANSDAADLWNSDSCRIPWEECEAKARKLLTEELETAAAMSTEKEGDS